MDVSVESEFSQFLHLVNEHYLNHDANPYVLLNIQEAADLLGISRSSFERLLLDPELPRIAIGEKGRFKIPKAGLIEYISQTTKHWYDK
ncbi:helix-turn-helix domain-containing protein [Lacticaseibacillus saniviri]|uniref:Helix-turn-helix domain-containing protein n=1 Tax=Lacticaseibacillus saniviri JCM 17471 = DSM 24301 TaxID=1293598 RepID=A0A0R2MN56_9LACO|nr:helix-turn-helix domain-containing protein [Lacticaseibacillus saniviri]KRO15135.1 hypothetical protein IV56_GL000224 [Lacticaseibacillus saniviri JCM 17471 = DSM 24301]MCG4281554.1 helix-turn-helix domain-containing protein [Lacticaseibacillus saniviri]